MDASFIVRALAGVAFLVVFGVIVMRRKSAV